MRKRFGFVLAAILSICIATSMTGVFAEENNAEEAAEVQINMEDSGASYEEAEGEANQETTDTEQAAPVEESQDVPAEEATESDELTANAEEPAATDASAEVEQQDAGVEEAPASEKQDLEIEMSDAEAKQSDDPYADWLASKRATSLTEEQVEAGWVLSGGYALSPEDQAGDASQYAYSLDSMDLEYSGSVTFRVIAPPDITDEILVTIIDLRSYRQYYFTLVKSMDYAGIIRLAVGDYRVTDAAPINDITGSYTPDEYASFRVEEGSAQNVTLKIHSRAQNAAMEDYADSLAKNEQEAIQAQKQANGLHISRWIYLLAGLVLLFAGGLIIYIFIRISRQSPTY